MVPWSSGAQALSSPLLCNSQFVVQNYCSIFSHLVHISAKRKLEKRRELAIDHTPHRTHSRWTHLWCDKLHFQKNGCKHIYLLCHVLFYSVTATPLSIVEVLFPPAMSWDGRVTTLTKVLPVLQKQRKCFHSMTSGCSQSPVIPWLKSWPTG